MSGPLVTVVLPARDGAATVARAVGSILGQTLGDLELLAIDDGSLDATGERLAEAARADARVRVLTTPGVGLVAALNLGLAEARGRWLARMDADDESLPTRLAQSVAALDAEPELTGVGTGVEIFRDDRPVSPNMHAYGRWLSSLTSPARLFDEALVESPLCHPSVTLRREALVAVGGWRDGDFPEDWELWLRLLAAGHRLTCLPSVLHRWRDHDRRLTRTDPRYREEAHLALKAEHARLRLAGRPCTIWGAGQVGLKLSRRLRAMGVTITRFIELSPRKVGRRLEGIPAVSPDALGPPSRDTHLLAAVGAKGAREEIRAHLTAQGWREGEHFTCVA